MKLAFSTLGCPAWDLRAIAANARAHGYDGVDFRGYLGELDLWRTPEFSSGIKETARTLADAGLEVPCVSASASAFHRSPRDRAAALRDVALNLDVCAGLGCGLLRVFGGHFPGAPEAEAVEIAAACLAQMACFARPYGVNVLVETHDGWLDSSLLRCLVETARAPNLGVVWDVHHPYRYRGEAPAATWANLGEWVDYTHIKDSVPFDRGGKDDYRYTLLGEGDVPVREAISCLKAGGYDGYLTVEWEKRWYPELEEPEVALPQYATGLSELLGG